MLYSLDAAAYKVAACINVSRKKRNIWLWLLYYLSMHLCTLGVEISDDAIGIVCRIPIGECG